MSEPDADIWPEIRHRLDASRAALERSLSPEEDRRILKERAQVLGRAPTQNAAPVELLEVVEFELAGEHYGIPIEHVREVCQLRELTPVPCTPAFVLGIINLRGEIRTIVDLKRFFDLPETGITELNRIILLEDEYLPLGVLADAILGIRFVPIGDLQPALPTLTGNRVDFLRGITGDRMVVLDAAKLLSDKRLLIDEEVPS